MSEYVRRSCRDAGHTSMSELPDHLHMQMRNNACGRSAAGRCGAARGSREAGGLSRRRALTMPDLARPHSHTLCRYWSLRRHTRESLQPFLSPSFSLLLSLSRFLRPSCAPRGHPPPVPAARRQLWSLEARRPLVTRAKGGSCRLLSPIFTASYHANHTYFSSPFSAFKQISIEGIELQGFIPSVGKKSSL